MRSGGERADAGGLPEPKAPLENPSIDRIPGDPLAEPRPDEPGVGPRGDAAPLENPETGADDDRSGGGGG